MPLGINDVESFVFGNAAEALRAHANNRIAHAHTP